MREISPLEILHLKPTTAATEISRPQALLERIPGSSGVFIPRLSSLASKHRQARSLPSDVTCVIVRQAAVWHGFERGMCMFHDRVDAGRQLARMLARYANREDVLVLGIPRGGVPVAFEVAQALHAPLDVLLVRKLGVPGERELAMGAIASGGARILNRRLIAQLGVTEKQVAETIAAQEAELQRREELYRGVRPGIPIQDRIIILVDDGIATGSSMLAAIEALRTLQPKKIVVAVPVAPTHADRDIGNVADEFICVDQPEEFYGIGQFYQDFLQTQDLEVRVLLERSAGTLAGVHKPRERGAA